MSDAEIKDIDDKTTRVCRTVYLVTYSQADKSIFPTRSDFAQAVVKSFSHGKARIEQWCCAEERHKKQRDSLPSSDKTDSEPTVANV